MLVLDEDGANEESVGVEGENRELHYPRRQARDEGEVFGDFVGILGILFKFAKFALLPPETSYDFDCSQAFFCDAT